MPRGSGSETRSGGSIKYALCTFALSPSEPRRGGAALFVFRMANRGPFVYTRRGFLATYRDVSTPQRDERLSKKFRLAEELLSTSAGALILQRV